MTTEEFSKAFHLLCETSNLRDKAEDANEREMLAMKYEGLKHYMQSEMGLIQKGVSI